MKDAIAFLLENEVQFTVTYRGGVPFVQIEKNDQSGEPNISEPVHDFMVGACESYHAYHKLNAYQFQK